MIGFAYPYLLLLILVPLVLMFFYGDRLTKENSIILPTADQFSDFFASSVGSNKRLDRRFWFFSLLWVLVVCALAVPQRVGPFRPVPRLSRNIMLAIDLSGSMSREDMAYHQRIQSRISVVKSVASSFINARKNDKMGLVVFGTHAYLQTPLTYDHRSLRHMLNDASVGLAGQRTAIGDAIGLSIKRLIHYPERSRVLILLTDGESNAGQVSPLEAARIANKNHIKIYTIGLTGSKYILQTPYGSQLMDSRADLNEVVLKRIAKMTHGVFFKAGTGSELKQVYNTLNQLEKTKDKNQPVHVVYQYYTIPLSLALLLSIFGVLVVIYSRYNKES